MFNIPVSHIRKAKSIKMTYDIDRLGKIQKNRLVKTLRTGVSVGGMNGVPTRIAMNLILKHDIPYLAISDNSIRWENMHDESFFNLMESAAVAAKLTMGQRDDWYLRSMIENVKNKKENGYFYDIPPPLLKRIAKEVEIPITEELVELANGIESGDVIEVELDITKHGSRNWMF